MARRKAPLASHPHRRPFLALLISGLLAASIPASAQAQAVLNFSPAAGSVDCAQTVYVDVAIPAGVTDLRGFTFTFQFDPTYVTPVSVQAGTLVTGAGCGNFFQWVNQGSYLNTLQLDATLLGCSVVGPGSIVRLGFAPGPQRGQSPLTTVSGTLRDANNQSISFTPPSGTVDNLCNTAPVATDNAYATNEDTAVGGNVITDDTGAGVDSDVDLDPLTVNTTPVSGPTHGILVLNADGSFTYTPSLNYFGIDQFVYTLLDGQGGSDTGAVTITVNTVNDNPVASDNTYATNEDTAAGGNVITDDTGAGVDSDLDGGTLTVNTTPVSGPTHGILVLNANGSFTYTPSLNFFGIDQFVYTLLDGQGGSDTATVTITVNGVNDNPVASDNAYSTNEDVAVGGNVITDDTGNGVDVDLDGGALSISTTPATPPTNGNLTLNANGTFSYTPNLNFNGPDTFTYTLLDGQGGSDVGQVSITVAPVNDAPVVTNPGNQTNTEYDMVALQIVAADVDPDALTYSATGLPTGLSIGTNTGLISGQIACGAAGPYTVVVTANDGNGGTGNTTFSWTVGALPTPVAISDLTATQVKSGNDVDGTTKIGLTWSGVGATHIVKVYRKGWGSYPEYDDVVPGAPTAPATPAAAVTDGWVETAVTASGGTDEVAARDFWYFVAFVFNECNTVSAVSNRTVGTLNYHLGDVSNGTSPPNGNNQVSTEDISYLGGHYGVAEGNGLYVPELDVGPTTNFSVDARPTTDNQIQFEDLILFGINYGQVSKMESGPWPSDRNLLTAFVDNPPPAGDRFDVQLWLAGDGGIQGLSVALRWDAAVVTPVGFTAGDLLAAQHGTSIVLSPEPGTIDATLFGVRSRGIAGEGLLATVGFRRLSEGPTGIGVARVTARDAANHPLAVESSVQSGTAGPTLVPRVSLLHPVYPNPFNPATTVAFGLAHEGRVVVRIYSLDGRLVRTLVDEVLAAGSHRRVWDGTDGTGRQVSSGAYVAKMIASDATAVRRMVLIK